MTSNTMSTTGTWLSPALAILLDGDGPRLTPDIGDFRPLGVADLVVIERLARGEEITGTMIDDLVAATSIDPARVTALIAALRDHGLLVDRPGHPSAVPATAREATAGDIDTSTMLIVFTPVALRVTPAGFDYVDHDGTATVTLDARELAATTSFVRPTTVDDAFALHVEAAGALALDRSRLDILVHEIERGGLARRITKADIAEGDNRRARELRKTVANRRLVAAAVDRGVAAHLETRAATSSAGLDRIDIVGVHPAGATPPLSIAMVMAYAREFEGGRLQDRFDFLPRWVMSKGFLKPFTGSPSMFLFTNYLWSTPSNLTISAEVKRLSPGSLIIHGGPDTPKYEADAAEYFAQNPVVDITVRGEGEATFAGILAALEHVEFPADRPPDLSVLEGVPGLCFRQGDRMVRTEDRERITDLDDIPSPYLLGLLDPYAAADEDTAIIETNRGCPYGCTFCDWGSATLSRIRKFDLDRIFGELEWCARNGIARVWLADANFGIFERDVEIAQKVAELKRTYGYPKEFSTNYAKNTVKHLKQIVRTMADAGVVTEGILSLQSMDADTLKTIKRSNIKTEKYDALSKEFRAANLPLYIDLMLGLPGATVEGFRDDLQQCIDREVNARIFETTLLVNSPMNEPAYKAENQIQTEVHGDLRQRLVVSSSSFTRADFDTMRQLREIYIICENHGLLRQISRFVHQESGMREVDLYETLWRTALNDRDRWPSMFFMFDTGPSAMVPPVSWKLFIDEVHGVLVHELGLPDDTALQTALDVQLALLPSRNRRFPDVLELAHDFGLWHANMIAAKDDGHIHDWVGVVPRLSELPPAQFAIDDPNQVCERNIGYHVEGDIYSDWEMRSPVSRSMPATHLVS